MKNQVGFISSNKSWNEMKCHAKSGHLDNIYGLRQKLKQCIVMI